MWANLLCSLFLMCGPVAPVSSGLPTWAETSTYAIPLVARWEGLSVTAYLDTIAEPDVWTICYGETANVRPGEVRTVAECEAGLRRLLRDPYWTHYRAGVTITALSPQTDAAFTSLVWNIGQTGLRRSTALRRLNTGDVAAACEALTWWNRAGGRVILGLQNRRADEYRLCMEGAT